MIMKIVWHYYHNFTWKTYRTEPAQHQSYTHPYKPFLTEQLQLYLNTDSLTSIYQQPSQKIPVS